MSRRIEPPWPGLVGGIAGALALTFFLPIHAQTAPESASKPAATPAIEARPATAPPPTIQPPPVSPTPNEGPPEPPFLEAFPNLKNYVYKEPTSGIFLGLGVTPLGTLKDRTLFAANFFQVHLITWRWDLEIFNASYGVTRAQSSTYQSNHFTFRMAPKIKIGQVFSLGPLVGYEFINFPNLSAKLYKSPYVTLEDSFSSRGAIYGAMFSQTFRYKDYLIQINEVGYQQNYSTTQTPEDWTYIYDSPEVRANPSLIAPSFVTMIEVSFLF